ncbi:MAG TPA: type II toxin-antitoxin system VapC family toxin [Bryobacteraceae bacterium]
MNRDRAFLFWEELDALPIRSIDVPVAAKLLELTLRSNLAVYDATYLRLALMRHIPIAVADMKLLQASQSAGVQVLRP